MNIIEEYQRIVAEHGEDEANAWLRLTAAVIQPPNGVFEDYNWNEAFEYAENVRTATRCDSHGFGKDDVAVITHKDEGENDGRNWICAGVLRDGRWFFLSAGCDYTGWDCQAGGDSQVADTFENLRRYGMGVEDRKRLGIPLDDELT